MKNILLFDEFDNLRFKAEDSHLFWKYSDIPELENIRQEHSLIEVMPTRKLRKALQRSLKRYLRLDDSEKPFANSEDARSAEEKFFALCCRMISACYNAESYQYHEIIIQHSYGDRRI